MGTNGTKISVLLTAAEYECLDRYCRTKGYKKSPLLVRLVREHLSREGFRIEEDLHAARPGERR